MQPTWRSYKMRGNLCRYWEHMDLEEDWRTDSRIYTADWIARAIEGINFSVIYNT
jgi:hypothetical protein